jgi:hypothetical protein
MPAEGQRWPVFIELALNGSQTRAAFRHQKDVENVLLRLASTSEKEL